MSREISFENIKEKLGIDDFSPIVDTHTHLDYLKFKSSTEIVELSKKLGVTQMVTIAVSKEHQDEVLRLTTEFDGVYCSQGVHPHHASELDDNFYEQIKRNSQNKKVVAIGEVGLDYHYDYSPRDVQRAVFEKMISLSLELSLPLIIHTREAEEDTMAILKNFKLQKGVLLHSYSSNKVLAEFGAASGFYFGLNGMITFKKSENVRELLPIIPLDRLVIETDAPFLAPVPFRGVENGPYLLPFVAQELSRLLSRSYSDIAKITTSNAKSLFSF